MAWIQERNHQKSIETHFVILIDVVVDNGWQLKYN
jgi:hypothetical protein